MTVLKVQAVVHSSSHLDHLKMKKHKKISSQKYLLSKSKKHPQQLSLLPIKISRKHKNRPKRINRDLCQHKCSRTTTKSENSRNNLTAQWKRKNKFPSRHLSHLSCSIHRQTRPKTNSHRKNTGNYSRKQSKTFSKRDYKMKNIKSKQLTC